VKDVMNFPLMGKFQLKDHIRNLLLIVKGLYHFGASFAVGWVVFKLVASNQTRSCS
jgi:hypothetical protein